MTAPAAAPREALLTHRQILAILGGLMIGMFLAALDNTIVATSIRTIADDLQGLTMQAWATTAYLITATITTPLYGKLSDLYGRKPLFLTAISVFVVGSAACAFATSMYQLAAFRAIQGIGAGGLFSLALTIIGDIVAPRERARYQGYFVAVFGTSSVLGPVVGGFFAGQAEILSITGWRWVFLINVPLGILALFVVTRVLNIPHTRRDHRIDWPGALALAVGLVPLLIVAEQGRAWGWGSERALLCYAVGAVGIIAFLLAEHRMGDDALLPLRFFRHGVFGWGTLAGFVSGMGMFGAIALLPLYLQIVKGASPTLAGLQTLPLMLGIMTMSTGSGRLISRTGRYKIWPIVGVSLMVVGLVLLALRLAVDTPYWQTAVLMLLIGLGLGGIMQPLTLAVQNAMPPKDMGVATASATFFRQMGGTLGTAVFLSLLFGALPSRIADGFRAAAGTPDFRAALADPAVAANPANAPILAATTGGPVPSLDDSSFLSAADPRLARPILEGFAGSMSVVLLAAAGMLLIGLVAVSLMRELPLRTVSGVEAQREPALDPSAVPAVVPEQAVVAPVVGNGRPAVQPWPSGNRTLPVAAPDGARPQPDGPVAPSRERRPDGPVAPSRDARPDGPVEPSRERRPDGREAPEPSRDARPDGPSDEAIQRDGVDVRDRLLALLLPDPQRAVEAVGEADRARDGIRRARRELDARTAEFTAASEELVAQGLSPAQVEQLVGERGGKPLTGLEPSTRRPGC